MATSRISPNILVTGTPGTGKSTLSQQIAESLGLKYINVGELVKEKGMHAGRDEAFDTLLIDEDAEDQILDDLEPVVGGSEGGVVLEHIAPSIFPERWFDLVLVLRSDNTVLFDRLAKRGYTPAKVQENMEAEIMRVIADEALESYPAEIVHELSSDTNDELESNVSRVEAWMVQWKADHHMSMGSSSEDGSSRSSSNSGTGGSAGGTIIGAGGGLVKR